MERGKCEMMSLLLTFAILLLTIISASTFSYATNEGSWQYGWQQGSLKSPQIAPSANWYPELDSNTCALGGSQILTYPKEVNGTVIPAVTNTTACKDGFSAGFKNWCINHAVDCVENMTLGHFPDMMLKD
jgi:hypothetical protein